MPSLELSNIVLKGNFNPYIITPEWLQTQGIWSSDDVQLALGALKGDGIQFVGSGVEWNISFGSLVIATKETKIDCSEYVIGILEALPHTPLSAVGCNFHFQESGVQPLANVFQAIRSSLGEKQEAQILKCGAIFHEKGTRIEVNIVTGDQGTTISFNHHRPAHTLKDAIAAARAFQADLQESIQYVNTILEHHHAI